MQGIAITTILVADVKEHHKVCYSITKSKDTGMYTHKRLQMTIHAYNE